MAPRAPIKVLADVEPEASGTTAPLERSMLARRRQARVTDALLLGHELAEALGAARHLIERVPTDSAVVVEQLRRWYYGHDPAERNRLLWRHLEKAKQTHARLEQAIQVAREALNVERPALAEAQAEREALAARPLSATVEHRVPAASGRRHRTRASPPGARADDGPANRGDRTGAGSRRNRRP